MAIYEVTLNYEYLGQECVNRWNYVSAGTPASVTRSFALWQAFTQVTNDPPPALPFLPDGVLHSIWLVAHSEVKFKSCTVFNVYDPTDFYASGFAFNPVGQSAGTAMSPFVAYGFTSSRNRRDVNRASKRFAGVSEANVGTGGAIEGVALPNLNGIATQMSEGLQYDDEGEVLSFFPSVCGKQRYLPNPDDPTSPAYRYYPTEAEQLQRTMVGVSWSLVPNVTTQNSRKVGKGR